MLLSDVELDLPRNIALMPCNRIPDTSRCKRQLKNGTCPARNGACVSRWATRVQFERTALALS
jgi:hypothetical protein